MRARPTHNAPMQSGDASPPLPAQLARSLGPEAKHALMHPMRRRLLRVLNEDLTPRTALDLRTTFPGVSLSVINYHLLVLEDCESLTVSRLGQTRGTFARSFVSNVTDNAQYVVVLRATELSDDAR